MESHGNTRTNPCTGNVLVFEHQLWRAFVWFRGQGVFETTSSNHGQLHANDIVAHVKVITQ
jgi:hypothetical protein